MSEPAGEHERTMAFAEIAFGQIKALRQPATPRNYEVWYTYATGYNPSLNQTINETLAKNGTLTDSDLDQVYSTYISPIRFTEKIDDVGSRVMDEINQVMAMMDAAVTQSTPGICVSSRCCAWYGSSWVPMRASRASRS